MGRQVKSFKITVAGGNNDFTASGNTSGEYQLWASPLTIQATSSTVSAAGTAVMSIQVSNVETPGSNDWIEAAEITLNAADDETDGVTITAPWRWLRVKATTVTVGTTAKVWQSRGEG